MNRFISNAALIGWLLAAMLTSAQTTPDSEVEKENSLPATKTPDSGWVFTKSGKSYKFRSVSRIDEQKDIIAIVHDGGISAVPIEDLTDDSLAFIKSTASFKEAAGRLHELAKEQEVQSDLDREAKEAAERMRAAQIDKILEHGRLYRETIASRKEDEEKLLQLRELAQKINKGEATFSDWKNSLSACSIELFTEIVGKPDSSVKGEVDLGIDGPKVRFDAEKYVYHNGVLNPTTGKLIGITVDVCSNLDCAIGLADERGDSSSLVSIFDAGGKATQALISSYLTYHRFGGPDLRLNLDPPTEESDLKILASELLRSATIQLSDRVAIMKSEEEEKRLLKILGGD